ncbi:hypothetical protein K7G92_001520 [Pasteurella canis]|uniref:hypothetical protein n=1 Tax=Pasteurella canis TaxID=753 RepID=UPI001E50201D|nr:hypothetical protein [Pasteurella canis]UEA16283.1 hypothetical protein K7G92_001520 [Pasteurella canis]
MQRLARFSIQTENQEAIELLSRYSEIESLLLRHLPPSTATLFARPEVQADGKIIEWYTDLQGQPQLLSHSSEDQKKLAEIQPHLMQRLNAIRQLNQELSNKGQISAAQSRLLTQLVEGASHNTRQIYLVNNEPVITGWGIGDKPTEPIPVVPAPAANKRWYWWLLPLLLLLALLLWWFWWRVPAIEPVKVEPVIEQPKEIPPEPVKVEEPKVEPPKVELPKVEPAPPEKVCRQKIIPAEAPQMAIIFNNASGMRYTIKEGIKKIDDFDKRLSREAVPQKDIDYMYRKPNRSTASKVAVNNILASIDPNIDIGLVELKSCLSKSKKVSAAVSHGIFTSGQRDTLKQKINKMKVRQNEVPGTPIYEGLQKALAMVDGIEREALILLITEGNGDCTFRDPCQLIQQELKRRPKLKVNIVSINSPWNATDCLANLTGGQIFNTEVNSEIQLTELINKAVKSVQTEEICE